MDNSEFKLLTPNKKSFFNSSFKIKNIVTSNNDERLDSFKKLKAVTPSRMHRSKQRYFDSPTFTISRGDRFEMSIFEKFKCKSFTKTCQDTSNLYK